MKIIIDNVTEGNRDKTYSAEYLIDKICQYNSNTFNFIRIPYKDDLLRKSKLRVSELVEVFQPDLYLAIDINEYQPMPLEHSLILHSRSAVHIAQKIQSNLEERIPDQKCYCLNNRKCLHNYALDDNRRKMSIVFLPFFINNKACLDKFFNTDYPDRLVASIIGGLESFI